MAVDSVIVVNPIVCVGSMLGLCFVVQYLVSFLVLQSSWWGRERVCCFTIIVFLIS